jgi:polyhydroxyalkanoate synthesis regulator protein
MSKRSALRGPYNVRYYQKYENRKLYDLMTGTYVSMLDLSNVVAGGEQVRVTCHRTGKNLTHEVLARALCDRLRVSREVNFSARRLASLFPLVRRRG